jgi:hypothetical protein
MKKKALIIVLAVVFISTTAFIAVQQNMRTEASRHPRIEKAIFELEDAVDYLQKAPDNFGGYKAQAIIDSKKAIASLKAALQYRAEKDNEHRLR